MMRFVSLLIVCLMLCTFAPTLAQAQLVPVSSEEALAWTRYLVPLPRSVALTAKMRLDPATVAVIPPAGSDIVINQACKELRVTLGRPGIAPNPVHPAFIITLQIGGPESADLVFLKNSDQAYKIVPEAGDIGLRIIALGARGLYYGVKTVQQLIIARYAPGIADMPILSVTDWPQITDRGVWGNDSFNRTRWMADRKMNYQEQIANRWLTSCVPHAAAKSGFEKMYTEGPYYGLEPCHAVLHLEAVAPSNLFSCYPNLKGVGDIDPLVWCYSQPEAVTVLAGWMADLKNLPYSKDVDVWMSENLHGKGGCKCATCSLTNRSALEARTIVLAWKKAMLTAGPMGLRILTTESTRNENQYIVEELQSTPTAKIMQYDGLITYMVNEKSIVDPYIQQWAAAGRYAGEVPCLSPATICPQPWTCPQFVHYRMQEMKNKNISCLMGYPSPGIQYYEFNTEASAEWAWNPDGRSAREFTVSWAVRQGLPDPEKFADWTELLGPVSWDVYGSEYPRGEIRKNANCGPIADALKNGTLQELGQVKLTIYPAPWADIKNVAQFNADVSAAIKALALAKTMNLPEFYYETLVVHGYITALRALYELKSLVVGGAVALENRELAANYFYIYVSGLKEAADVLPKWEMAAGGTTTRVTETVDLLMTDISQMTLLATNLGCPISSTFTLVPVTSIPEAKGAYDGTFVTLGSEVVTSAANGSYIQEGGGAPIGLKVQTTLPLTPGVPVAIMGKMATVNGERVLNATMVVPISINDEIGPLCLKTSDLGGKRFGLQAAVMEYRGGKLLPAVGVHNLGVMFKVAGKVTAHGTSYFYIDDGAKCDDGSGNSGVRVICGSIEKPPIGAMVIVTAISSSYYERSRTWRALVLPSAENLEVVQ